MAQSTPTGTPVFTDQGLTTPDFAKGYARVIRLEPGQLFAEAAGWQSPRLAVDSQIPTMNKARISSGNAPAELALSDGTRIFLDANTILYVDSIVQAEGGISTLTLDQGVMLVVGSKVRINSKTGAYGAVITAGAMGIISPSNTEFIVNCLDGVCDLSSDLIAEKQQLGPGQRKEITSHIQGTTDAFGKFGTSGGIDNYEKIGNFPVKNWKQGRWAGAKKISGVAMHDTILSGRKACMHRPIACGRHIKVTEGPYAPKDCERPEYESIGTLGGLCLVDDLVAIAKANQLCNQYGLDTISAGGIIAFATEAYEKGIITRSDTDGVELIGGSAEALGEMVHKMGSHPLERQARLQYDQPGASS